MTAAVERAALISLPEIAELSGVQRPVVTTWRRRHADFPAPISADRGRPLFDARQVIDWLVDTGRADRQQIEPDLRLHLLTCLAWATPTAMGIRRRTLTPSELVAATTALICLRHLDDEPLHGPGQLDRHVIASLRERAIEVDPDDDLLRSEIETLSSEVGWLPGVIDELIEAAYGPREAYERVLAVRSRFNVPALHEEAVAPALARLVAGLSGAREHADRHGFVRIADPAANVGDLLMAVRSELSEGSSCAVVAAEADPFQARVARRRLVVHGHLDFAGSVTIGDRLPAQGPAADVVIVRLPYSPAEERGGIDLLARVDELTSTLAPGQTAVVLGPTDLLVNALPPYQKSAQTRRSLLASGRVEAVVKLPGGLVPFRPGYQIALWVMRREDSSAGRGLVLLADVSNRALTGQVVDTVVWDIVTWRRDGHHPDQHPRAFARQVKVEDLIAVPRRPLTARHPISIRDATRDGGVVVADVTEVEAALDRLAEPRPRVRAAVAARAETAPASTQSIRALIRTGWLTLVKGARVMTNDIAPGGHHVVIGSAELTGGSPVGARRVDRGVLAEDYPRVRLTEPDDIVLTLTPQLATHHDEAGFSIVEFPARVLRISPAGRERLTPRVLVALLDTAPAGRARGAVRAATRLTDIQLPVLPPAEVVRLDALLAAVDARRALALRELELLDDVCRLAVSGLTDGKLTLT